MELYILLVLLILILAAALVYSFLRTPGSSSEREYLLLFRDTASAVSSRIMNTPDSTSLYQFILESCLKLIPKAKCGNVLMFNAEGLLVARASVGFGKGISDLKLRLEDSFIYLATGGRLTGPVIMNRLGDIMPSRESDDESGEPGEQSSAIKSEIAAPLFDNGQLVGLLCIDADKIDVFTDREVTVLDYMSHQISIVINYQKLKNEAEHLSRYDSQTDLMNRSSFEQEIFKIFGDPSRDTANLYFVLMNLDGLRHANETFGHHFGDKTIENFAEIMQRQLGKNDLCGRYGGDEFVAVIQGDFLHVNFVLESAKKRISEFKKHIPG